MVTKKLNDKALVFSFLPIKKTGGGESYTLNCANSISASGIECDLIAPTETNFVHIKDSSRFESLFDITYFIGGASLASSSKASFVEILSKIPSYKYIWIHQYLASPLVYDLMLTFHHQQIILFTNHGFEENDGDFWIRYHRLPNHFFIEVSKYSARRTQKYTSNVNYVYAGAWKDKLEKASNIFPDKNQQFVSVGRLLPHKAFEVSIEALSKNDTFIIIGPDSEDQHYKEFLEMKIKGKKVDIAGEIISADKDRIISNSVALIANSSSVTYNNHTFQQSELLGLVIIESILNNTLPITSSQPALKEIMTVLNLDELVYIERNSKSLRSKMLLVRSLPTNEYRRLLEQAKKVIQHQFLWDNYWLRVQEIIEQKIFLGTHYAGK